MNRRNLENADDLKSNLQGRYARPLSDIGRSLVQLKSSEVMKKALACRVRSLTVTDWMTSHTQQLPGEYWGL